MDARKISSLTWMFAAALVLALAMVGWGLCVIFRFPGDRLVLAVGGLSAIIVLAAWSLVAGLQSAASDAATRREALQAPVTERLQQITAMLTQIAEQQLISERAKAIAFRENEREALRRAIREETNRKDWDAALVLANEIEEVFGYKGEADRIREEIFSQQEVETRKQVSEGLAVIDRHCRAELWTLALREAERLMPLFPDDEEAQRLPAEVEKRRQQFKKQLQDQLTDALSRHDIDGGVEILKQLDLYLTPAEAQAMQDSARQLFKDKLLQLGQQFTVAVKEHQWGDAVRTGETIIEEYPNSRMAQEVGEKLELLRKRATEGSAAKA